LGQFCDIAQAVRRLTRFHSAPTCIDQPIAIAAPFFRFYLELWAGS
jgi:hypothetical protein